MEYPVWIAIIQGIVEGLTEFLPVSSTGHLILVGHLLGFEGDKAETFEIVIQLGAILAIVVLYWRKLLSMTGWRGEEELKRRRSLTLAHMVIAVTPAFVCGFLLHGIIRDYLFTPTTVLIGLVIGSIFMIWAEKRQTFVRAREVEDITYKQAFQIGLFQCLSLWPGFSRAGATIAGGLLAGASLRAAADFSFLIAVPVIFVAGGYDLYKSWHLFGVEDLPFMLTGFIVSFVVAMLAVVSFLKLLQKLKLSAFAYYRFVLAALFWIYMSTVGLG